MTSIRLTIKFPDGTDHSLSHPVSPGQGGNDRVICYESLCESLRTVQDKANEFLTTVVEQQRNKGTTETQRKERHPSSGSEDDEDDDDDDLEGNSHPPLEKIAKRC